MTIITSKSNKLVKNISKLKKSASYRNESGMYVAEGLRLCKDAMLSGSEIVSLFVTEQAIQKHSDDFEALSRYCENTYMVSSEIFSLLSDTQNPQGFLCVIKILDKITQFDTIKNGNLFLALDNVQDPNNLGTVLRSSEAFGISAVILSKDCCDVYSPKVVRGSMGAVFRIPFVFCESVAEFLYENPELNSYAAVVERNASKITEISFEHPCVAVIGNEGNGLKTETITACKHKITIPMAGKAESLNASTAASIIIWEMIK